MERLGYLGPQGTHSEAAAIYLNKVLQQKYEFVECKEIFEILHEVEEGKLNAGFVPVENSLEGSINVTLDTLARSKTLKINRELVWKIHNNLFAKNDTKISDIKKIFSHSQPISQCRKYLQKNFADAEFITTPSTSRAAEIVATSEEKNIAAICSKRAGEIYNLKILAEEIQDNPFNSTRFFEIIRDEKNVENFEGEKISLVCMVDGSYSGVLCRVLEEFANREINMTHIESRPARLELGEYIFFFDLEINDKKNLQDAINAIRKKTIWLKNLGSYSIIK